MRIIGILEFLCDSENSGGDEDHRGSSADSEAALHILQFLPSRRNHRPKAPSRGSRTDRLASEKKTQLLLKAFAMLWARVKSLDGDNSRVCFLTLRFLG